MYHGTVLEDSTTIRSLRISNLSSMVVIPGDRVALWSAGTVAKWDSVGDEGKAYSGGAAAGSSGGTALPPDATDTAPGRIRGGIKTPDGHTITVSVHKDHTVGELKKALSEQRGIALHLIQIIFRGSELKDTDTMRAAGFNTASCMHLVMRAAWPPPPGPIGRCVRGNCTVCNTPGAAFQPRPLCAECLGKAAADPDSESKWLKKAEACMVDGTRGFDKRTTGWQDLLDMHVLCGTCKKRDGEEYPDPEFPLVRRKGALGFLCDAKRSVRGLDGKVEECRCESTKREGCRVQFATDCSNRESIKKCMEQLFGRADAGGLQDSCGPGELAGTSGVVVVPGFGVAVPRGTGHGAGAGGSGAGSSSGSGAATGGAASGMSS